MIHRAFRYKLNPTPEQESLLRQFVGVTRLVYNLALEQRRDWWRAYQRVAGSRLNYIAQAKELTKLRAEFDWIAAVHVTPQQQALRDLDAAYANFFAGRAAYPQPRKRGVNDAFRFQGREIETRPLNGKWSAVRLPKIGWVKFRDSRPMRGKLLNVTVSAGAEGWHVSFAREVEHEAPPRLAASVGVDRGVAAPVMLSTGEAFQLPPSLARLEQLHRRAQRTASRRKRGSARYAKAQRRAAKIKAKAARVRSHWQHEVSASIARRFGVVALEKLKTANMTRSAKGTAEAPGANVKAKSGLNRSILNVGWFGLETKLAYKMAERGGVLLHVDPAYTSQTCSDCGAVDSRARESQARFVCPHCGFRANADWNAALNIRQRGNTALLLVEDGHGASGEARTTRGAVSRQPRNPPASAGGGC